MLAPTPTPKRMLIFGASGTVGAGALLECLDHPGIAELHCVVRRPTGRSHPKLREWVHEDLSDLRPLTEVFKGVDGCLWAVGVTSVGRSEQEYAAVTEGYTLAAAKLLHTHSPDCCFIFVSAAGADQTGQGRSMWARVKGRTEVAILNQGFAQALVLRPWAIVAQRGLRHNVRMYSLSRVIGPLLRPFGLATSTTEVGRAVVAAVLGKHQGAPCLNSADINALAAKLATPPQDLGGAEHRFAITWARKTATSSGLFFGEIVG